MRRKPLRDREYLLLTRLEIGLRKVSKSPRIFVFRDGAQVGKTDAVSFFDPAPEGMHVWYVTAFNGEQSPPSNTFEGGVP